MMSPALPGPGGEWPALQKAIERSTVVQPATTATPMSRLFRRLIPGGKGLAKTSVFPNGIYILIYHSIVDPDHRQPWEACYRKGETTVAEFRAQLEFMMTRMTPVALGELPGLWERGGPDRPCFAVTFDDGFTNNLTHAHPVIRSLGLKPTVFVCSEFAGGRQSFFRVLAALLVARGHASRLAAVLGSMAPEVRWPETGEELFARIKDNYVADVVEEATTAVFHECLGDPAALRIHLDCAAVAELERGGWEIGNHTTGHRLLGRQTATEAVRAIEDNECYWKEKGISLIDFLAYPVGRSVDVAPAVGEWLERHPRIHGIFANGGINFSLCRSQWLRFSLGKQTSPQGIERIILQQIQRTRQALESFGA
ncbi:MAG: polysaccharide deacetylase family protein [Magnetococcales bacterium]|nr:polysaccharide deacetylase family protein [Magnetococcales bacterium]